jgi:hypothetical protein
VPAVPPSSRPAPHHCVASSSDLLVERFRLRDRSARITKTKRDPQGEDHVVVATRTSGPWERYVWAAGILFVLALVAEVVISAAIPVNQDDSAAKIANELAEHRKRLLAVACLSIVYATAFVIYLWRLYDLLRGSPDRRQALSSLVLIGGILFVSLHAVSDIGIIGMLGAKLATFSAEHDQGVAYTLYLTTFALDSVGDVFGSLFAVATGLLVMRSGVLPRWLAWVSILVGVLFFLQGFGLGGVIHLFGLVLDLIGFVLFLIFVLVSSVIFLRREKRGFGHHRLN